MPRCCRLLAWLLLVLALAPTPALAQRGSPSAESVQAAFLFKFGSYVDWPQASLGDSGTEFVIGVLGSAKVAEELQTIVAGRTVQQRPVVVRSLEPGEPLQGLHVLFIGDTPRAELDAALAALHGQPTLVVTGADVAGDGGMIDFVVMDGKLRFDVALDAAAAAGLKISSRLLTVARRVSGVP